MSMTVAELVSRFLSFAERCLSHKTWECYTYHLSRFSAFAGHLPVSDVRPFHLQEWGKSWHEYQSVQRMFGWAVDDAELLTKNPVKRLRRPPIGERHRVCSRQEQVTLLRRSSRPLRALLLAYRETFARPGELRNANVTDLKAEAGITDLREALRMGRASIVLREYKARKRRKNPNVPRVILLSPRVGRLIARELDRRGVTEGPLFVTRSRQRWTANAVRCSFRRLRKRAEIKCDQDGEQIVPYTFRHTGATLAASLGVRDRLLAELMGHTSTRTTARYQHLAIEHVRNAMRPLWERKRQIKGPDSARGPEAESRLDGNAVADAGHGTGRPGETLGNEDA